MRSIQRSSLHAGALALGTALALAATPVAGAAQPVTMPETPNPPAQPVAPTPAPPTPEPPAAEPPPEQVVDPVRVRGIERPALAPDDPQREAAAGVLFIPRELVKLMFLATGLTAGLIRDENVVPRVSELLAPRPGSYSVLPSLFLDSRRRASAGAELLGNSRFAAMRLAFGFGGVHDLLGEARVAFAVPRPLPLLLTLETLADSRSTLEYLGVGQSPGTDPRNLFAKNASTRDARYFEQRQRAIASLGARVTSDVEWLLSSSLLRSSVDDTPGGGPATITRVFQPGTVPGAPSLRPGRCAGQAPGGACPVDSRISYSEMAVRLDTRPSKTRPSPGVLLEGYGGAAMGVAGDPARFFRVGGRAAGFVSLVRRSNILSPKVVVDGDAVSKGAAAVAFTQLVSQPDFRGLDTRVDHVSVVYSLDYRWSMLPWLGPRLFLDAAQIGPGLAQTFKVPPRFAGGLGFDLFSDATELAETLIAFSNEGVHVLFSFGLPTQFGDRQHRR